MGQNIYIRKYFTTETNLDYHELSHATPDKIYILNFTQFSSNNLIQMYEDKIYISRHSVLISYKRH